MSTKENKAIFESIYGKVNESKDNEYNDWLKELNELCEDVNNDYGDKDALFFARAGFPNAFVKGKKLDQMVEEGEANDLSEAFAIIADEYTNANFTYDFIDEKSHQIEIGMSGQTNKVDLTENSKSNKKHVREAVDGGWEVKESDAWKAYDFACERLGKETVDEELIKGMSSEELASGLAYMFRMYDFREWEEENEE